MREREREKEMRGREREKRKREGKSLLIVYKMEQRILKKVNIN
jgi:hypothetical protein